MDKCTLSFGRVLAKRNGSAERETKGQPMALSFKKPSREPKAQTSTSSASGVVAGEKRLVAQLPERIHHLLRQRCLDRKISIREYILECLEKDGIL